MQIFILFLARALSDFLKGTLVDFQQILKEKYFVYTKNFFFFAFFVFAAMASSFKTKRSSSVTDGKRDAFLTPDSKSTNNLGYRQSEHTKMDIGCFGNY